MQRLTDWRPRLVAEIDAWTIRAADAPDTNCAFFAADCVRAMTGVDLAHGMRGRGLDIETGLAALRDAGFRDAVAFVADQFEEVRPSRAQTGDIAAVPEKGGLALGIVSGALVAVVRPAGGLGFVGFEEIARAFRV